MVTEDVGGINITMKGITVELQPEHVTFIRTLLAVVCPRAEKCSPSFPCDSSLYLVAGDLVVRLSLPDGLGCSSVDEHTRKFKAGCMRLSSWIADPAIQPAGGLLGPASCASSCASSCQRTLWTHRTLYGTTLPIGS